MKTKTIIIILLISVVFNSLVVYGQTEDEMNVYGKITKVVFDDEGKMEKILIENFDEEQEPY